METSDACLKPKQDIKSCSRLWEAVVIFWIARIWAFDRVLLVPFVPERVVIFLEVAQTDLRSKLKPFVNEPNQAEKHDSRRDLRQRAQIPLACSFLCPKLLQEVVERNDYCKENVA